MNVKQKIRLNNSKFAFKTGGRGLCFSICLIVLSINCIKNGRINFTFFQDNEKKISKISKFREGEWPFVSLLSPPAGTNAIGLHNVPLN